MSDSLAQAATRQTIRLNVDSVVFRRTQTDTYGDIVVCSASGDGDARLIRYDMVWGCWSLVRPCAKHCDRANNEQSL
jgi:hypothetical protein